MKIANRSGKLAKSERGVSIEIRPDTNGPKVRTLRVALSREVGELVPEAAKVVRLKNKQDPNKKGILMMFPEDSKKDDRVLVIDGFDHTVHRSSIGIDSSLTTAEILDQESGYGAWGSGVAFIAILAPGQRIVSTRHGSRRRVLWIEDSELKYAAMTEEEWVQFNGPTSEVFETEEL